MINTGGVPRNGLSLGSQGTRDEVRVLIQSGETPVFGQALMTMYVNTDNARVAPGLVAEFTTVANGALDTTLVSIDPTIAGLRVEYLVENLDVRQWLTTEEIGQANLRPLAMRLWFLSNDPRFTSLLRIPLVIPLIQR